MPKIKIGRNFRFSVNKSSVRFQWKFRTWIHLYSILLLNPVVRTMGIMSRCKDDPHRMHCLFLDYDDCMIEVVLDDIKFIQREHDAGTAVILQTGGLDANLRGAIYGNFHVVFPTKFHFADVDEIISKTHCDFNFRQVAKRFNYRAFVLRIYPKVSETGRYLRERPKLFDVIYEETDREVHEAIYSFLVRYYKMPEWVGRLAPKLDGLTELNLINYNTTIGWTPAIKQSIKSLSSKIKMRFGFVGGVE